MENRAYLYNRETGTDLSQHRVNAFEYDVVLSLAQRHQSTN